MKLAVLSLSAMLLCSSAVADGSASPAARESATEMTENAGGDFARMMIAHQSSAIDMVDGLLAENDIDPDLRAMAEQMGEAQAKEIPALQKWLQRHPNPDAASAALP